jgi:hypothetical protein
MIGRVTKNLFLLKNIYAQRLILLPWRASIVG